MAESVWRRDPRDGPTLLVVYAHPDDETFGSGYTLARYAGEGVAVHYACATRGECGIANPGRLAGHADAGALRTAELLCAADALGLASVHFLGYRDSGMPGSPDNRHPDAFAQAPLERAIGQVTALVRALRPQVVLTFNPYGGYGHPDHVKAHRVAVAAFGAAGDPAQYPEQVAAGLTPWSPQKLYYSTFSPGVLKVSIPLLRLLGRDPRRFGENRDVDLVEAAAQVTPVTTAVAAGAFAAQKERAMLCHRSQLGGLAWLLHLPAPIRRLLATEHYTRVVPPWDGSGRRERDLFAGVSRG